VLKSSIRETKRRDKSSLQGVSLIEDFNKQGRDKGISALVENQVSLARVISLSLLCEYREGTQAHKKLL